MSTGAVFNSADLINSTAYPLGQSHPQLLHKIENIRAELKTDGCAVIPNFLSAAGLATMRAEAEARRPQAFFSDAKKTNVYFSEDDPALPKTHPRRIFLERTNGFITSDCFEDETASRTLYNWPALKDFVRACLGKSELFIYDDPVSNMIVNVLTPGSQFNWHFDTNEFTITMLLKSAESGGRFEYAPMLRHEKDECYEDVRAVISGDRTRVKHLDLKPGDLQLFLGRFSLHRVTPNTGHTDRLMLIMSFAEKPGMIGSLERTQALYGKVKEAHVQSHAHRVRADHLMD